MAMGLQHYPPSLKDVPGRLAVPGVRYWLYALALILSLLLFLAVYLALIAGAGFLIYLAVIYPITTIGYAPLILKLGLIGSSIMLFLFLVKGLFRRREPDYEGLHQILEGEHPELFAFVRRLCREVHAPFPYRIFLMPGVNAAVTHEVSLLNLLFPVKKNLIIGVGLVNSLTINEFKAVLAHEFGHFSQASLAIGSYAAQAMEAIDYMVNGEDRWDEQMEEWRYANIRIAVFAWLLTGVVWVLRKFLLLIFRALTLVSLALSRQEEYHADMVALSVTGSDALVHALARIDAADDALRQALEDVVKVANSRGMYSRDLFAHQSAALEYLRRARRSPNLGNPPPLPEDPTGKTQVFLPAEGQIPALFRSHPTPYEREQNLKRRYFRSTDTGGSPWVLFRNPEAVREQFTRIIYQRVLVLPSGVTLADPAQVQEAINEAHGDSQFDARYFGVYDARFLEPGDLAAQVQNVQRQPWPRERLSRAFNRLYGGEIKEWMTGHSRRLEEHAFLSAVDQGRAKVKGSSFQFRGVKRSAGEVKSLLRTLEAELERDREWLSDLDREVFLAHYQMAASAAPALVAEYVERYRFHLRVQELAKGAQAHLPIVALLARAAAGGGIPAEETAKAVGFVREARTALGAAAEARETIIPIRNIPNGMRLGQFLLPGPAVAEPQSTTLPDRYWLEQLGQQLAEVHGHGRRLHYQSLADILALQERIAGIWRGAAQATPAAPPSGTGAST